MIFVGRVIERQQDHTYVPPKIENASPAIQKMIASRKRWELKIQVDERIKGVYEDELTMIDYTQDGPCESVYFEEDDEVLFFASKGVETGELLPGGICSRTRRFDGESEDYVKLKVLVGGGSLAEEATVCDDLRFQFGTSSKKHNF